MIFLAIWYTLALLLGLCVGSFLNVVVGRLPYEKSLIWPSSRCPICLHAIRWYHNVPLVGYLALRGRCRDCGVSISPRYFVVELLTGMMFVGLFHLEMVLDVLQLPILKQWRGVVPGGVMPEATFVFWHHAILVSFLLAASLCDLADMEIPLGITLTGTVVGLILATMMPWPFPESPPGPLLADAPLFPATRGVYAWPVWFPLPAWLPAGSWRLGLATGLAGVFAGMVLLRGIRFLFALGRGIEGLGVGDADLMMMAGAFLGWQPVVVAFFVAVPAGLVFALAQLAIKGEQSLPFGPSLSLGVVVTMLCWPAIGAALGPAIFDPFLIGGLAIASAVALLLVSFLLRVI